jgi:hypothetical protein
MVAYKNTSGLCINNLIFSTGLLVTFLVLSSSSGFQAAWWMKIPILIFTLSILIFSALWVFNFISYRKKINPVSNDLPEQLNKDISILLYIQRGLYLILGLFLAGVAVVVYLLTKNLKFASPLLVTGLVFILYNLLETVNIFRILRKERS